MVVFSSIVWGQHTDSSGGSLESPGVSRPHSTHRRRRADAVVVVVALVVWPPSPHTIVREWVVRGDKELIHHGRLRG